MPEELQVLLDVAARLDRLRLPCILCGAAALNFHTGADLILPPEAEIEFTVVLGFRSARRFGQEFKRDYFLVPDEVVEATLNEGFFMMTQRDTTVRIVCRRPSPAMQIELNRRHRVLVGGAFVQVISKEDLILAKLWRAIAFPVEPQIRDVRRLISSGCDKAYIMRRAKELGVEALWRELDAEASR